MIYPSLKETIDLIHKHGGKAVLAHQVTISKITMRFLMKWLNWDLMEWKLLVIITVKKLFSIFMKKDKSINY